MLLSSNEFWGRRSGQLTPNGNVFRQIQYASGRSNDGKQTRKRIFRWPMSKKWYGMLGTDNAKLLMLANRYEKKG